MTVHVHVDELVVEGLPGIDEDALRAATANELSRLLRPGELPTATRSIDAGEPEHVGREIAKAVAAALPPKTAATKPQLESRP